MKMNQFLGLLIFSLLLSLPATAQKSVKKKRKQVAIEHIQNIKEGVLILRLSSYRNKIELVEKLLSDTDLAPLKRTELEQELEQTLHARDTVNYSLVRAFQQEYTFSDWLILYDTASTALKNGVQKGIFLNRTLQPDPDIDLAGRSYCVVQWKKTDEDSGNGLRSLVVLDPQYEQLKPPFPYYVRSNNPGNFAKRAFGSEENLPPSFWLNLVYTFNQQMLSFYDRFH